MTRAKYRVIVEVEAITDTSGTRETFLFGYDDWTTGPADTPANTPVLGCLKSAGSYSRQLFRNGALTGRIEPDYGYTLLTNRRLPELGGAGELDAWADYSISGATIVVRRGLASGAVYPDDFQVLWTSKGLNKRDGDDIALLQRDDLQILDQPLVTEGFAGTGGIEGTGTLPKRKQFVSASPGYIEPVPIQPTIGVYFVQSTSSGGLHDAYTLSTTPTEAPFAVLVNGILAERQAPNYTSASEMLSTAPTAGKVRFWFGSDSAVLSGWKNGPVYFRLGTPATGEVRVLAYGGPTDNDHSLRGSGVGSFFASTLALRAGIERSRIDFSSDLAIEDQLADDDRTYLDALTDVATARIGWFGQDRFGMFRSGYLLDPNDDGYYYGVDPSLFGTPPDAQPTTSAFTFTKHHVLLGSLGREAVAGFESPKWSFSVRAGETWPSQVDASALQTVRDYLTRDVWAAFSGVSDSTRLADPGAGHLSIEVRGRYFTNTFGIRIFLERLCVLFGGRHYFWKWSVLIDDDMDEDILGLDLHDVVTLQFDHIGLSSGVKVRIVSMKIDLSTPEHKIEFVGWGGEKGSYTGTAPGGGADEPPLGPGGVPLGETYLGTIDLEAYATVPGPGAWLDSTIGNLTLSGLALYDSDPYFASVVLLMHMEADSPWIDSSSIGATLTASGTIAASSSSPLVGSKSMVPGASGKVNTPTNATYNMGTGSITVEFMLYLTGTPSTERVFELGGVGLQMWFNGSTTAPTLLAQGGTVFTASALSTSTLYHIAICKTAGATPSYEMWANGTSIGSGTRAGNDDGVTTRTIAVGNFDAASQPAVNCKVDEFRVTKGVVRYSGSFTPPTTPFPGY